MGLTYEKAAEVDEQLVAVRAKHHAALAAVTIAALFVHKIDTDGESHQALRHQGFPALATVTVTGLKHRALGLADVVLLVDASSWKKLGKRERAALLDHELEHLELVADKLDDLGRPCLRLRFHDWRLEGFRSVVARHGRYALEAKAVEACRDEEGQYYWEWAKAKASSKANGKPKGAGKAAKPSSSTKPSSSADASAVAP